jgi:3-hydroxyacyl-[acyl-carrier-protein] dehydratase
LHGHLQTRCPIDKKGIKKIIPYSEPFLFLDRVTRLSNKDIIAEKRLDKDYPFFKGHFTGFPLMPGMLTLEAVGQTATLLVRHTLEDHQKKDVLLASISSARFFAPLFPGDTIILKARILRSKGPVFNCSGEASKENRKVCSVSFVLVAVDKKKFRTGRPRR